MLLLATAAAAATLSLPPGQDPAPWANALARAGLTLVAADGDVQLVAHGDGWWLLRRADPCTAYAWPVPATPDARDALVLAARVLAGDEPLPSFDEGAPTPPPPPAAPVPVCPDGPTVLPARATAPPDQPRAGPLVWSLPPAAAPPTLVVHPLPRAPTPRPPDAIVVRAGVMRPWADLSGPAGLRAGAALRSGPWSLGAELEAELPAQRVASRTTVTRQYLGVRAAWGQGLRVAVSGGAGLLELDSRNGSSTVLWEPRVAVDGEVCATGSVDVCAWGGVGADLIPVKFLVHGSLVERTDPLVLRVGLSVEIPVARAFWRTE